MKGINFFIFLVMLVGCVDSKDEKPSLEGVWVGSYAHQVHRVEYPVLMELRGDGTLIKLDYPHPERKSESHWSLKDSVLTLDTIQYVVRSHSRDELSLFKNYEVRFRRPQQNVLTTDVSSILQQLRKSVWERKANEENLLLQERIRYGIKGNKIIKKRDYLNSNRWVSSEYEVADLLLSKFGGFVFMVKRAEMNPQNWHPCELEQILEMRDGAFSTFKTKNSKRYNYHTLPTSNPSLQVNIDSLFSLCYPDHQTEYFNIGLTYFGGFRKIKNTILKNYNPPLRGDDQTGYIRIRFVVNCNLKQGQYDVRGYDTLFNEKKFLPEVTNQLFKIVQGLNDWERKPDMPVTDANRFLTFKLMKGRIIEVLP